MWSSLIAARRATRKGTAADLGGVGGSDTQAELLSGAKAPRQPQARREYLAQLYLRATVGDS